MATTVEVVSKLRDEASAGLKQLGATIDEVSSKGGAALNRLAESSKRDFAAADRAAGQLLDVVGRLGPGFDDLKTKLQVGQAVNQAARDLKSLEAALRAGVITSQEFGRASLALNTQSGTAAQGLGTLNDAAKRAAKGGMQELAGQVPVVGSTLSQLASTLSGFPLLLGGIIGVGVGVISFLKQMQQAATENLSAVTALSTEIGTRFRHAVVESQKAIATANQDRAAVIALTYKQEVRDAQDAADAKIAKAKDEFDKIDQAFFTSFDEREAARKKFETAEQNAIGVAAAQEIEAKGRQTAALIQLDRDRVALARQLAADLISAQAEVTEATLKAQGQELAAIQANTEAKLATLRTAHEEQLRQIDVLYQGTVEGLDRRRQAEETYQAQSVKLQQTADAQKKASLESTTAAGVALFEKLGAQFEDLGKRLKDAQFTQELTKGFTTLKSLQEAGLITAKEYAAGQGAIKDALKDGAPAAKQAMLSQAEYNEQVIRGGKALGSFGPEYDKYLRDLLGYPDVASSATSATKDLNQSFDQVGQSFAATRDEAEKLDASTRNLASSGQAVATAANQTQQAIDALADSYRRAAQAARELESIQTKKSLDDSMLAVAAATRTNAAAQTMLVDRYRQSIGAGRALEDVLTGHSLDESMNTVTDAVHRLGEGSSQLATGFRSGIGQTLQFSASLEQLVPLLGTTQQILLGFGPGGPIYGNVNAMVENILKGMQAAEASQRLIDKFLERTFNPRKVGTVDQTNDSTDALERQAAQLQAQIRYNQAYGLSVETLTQQLAALTAQIERLQAAEAIAAFGGPTTLGMGGRRTNGNLGTQNFSAPPFPFQSVAAPVPSGSVAGVGPRAGAVQIVINQAPGQRPQDLARALTPVLRRERSRGTL